MSKRGFERQRAWVRLALDPGPNLLESMIHEVTLKGKVANALVLMIGQVQDRVMAKTRRT